METHPHDASPFSLPSPGSPPLGELSVAQVIGFIRRYWLFIVVCGLVASLTAVVFIMSFVPRRYEAAATLVIMSPKGVPAFFPIPSANQSETSQASQPFRPPTLTVQGYQTLLESDAVLVQATQRLIAAQVLKKNAALVIGKNVETRIFVSEKYQPITLAPMLQVVARAASPEQAAAIANAMAEVFVERTQKIMQGTTSASVQFVEREYPRAREQLASLERRQISLTEAFQQRLNAATARWEETLANFAIETQDQHATLQHETAQGLMAFKNETAEILAQVQEETAQLVMKFAHETRKQVAEFGGETDRQVEELQDQTLTLSAEFQDVTGTLSAEFQDVTTRLQAGHDDATTHLIAEFQAETAALSAAFQNETDTLRVAFHGQTAELNAGVQAETEDFIASFRSETKRVAAVFTSQRSLEMRSGQRAALQHAHNEIQAEQARVHIALQQQQQYLHVARRQLEATPASLTLQKAITDDVLWQTVVQRNGQGPDWTALQGRSLVSEQLNPLYSELSSQVSRLEREVSALQPRGQQLAQELEQLQAQLLELDTGIRNDEVELTQLQEERAAGLAKLRTRRDIAVQTLGRERERQLAAFVRERGLLFADLERERALQLAGLKRTRAADFADLKRKRTLQLVALRHNRAAGFADLERERTLQLATLERNRALGLVALQQARENQLAALTNARARLLDQRTQERQNQLKALTQTGERELLALTRKREVQLGGLQRQQQQELQALAQERDAGLNPIIRDMAQQQALYDQLTTDANQATLAKAQQDVEDVRLGAPAVAVPRPAPRGTLIKAALALFVGGLLGLFIAVIRELIARVESPLADASRPSV